MIRTLPVRAEDLGFVSAGQPEPVMVWEEIGGRRTLTDRQEHDEQGMPLWTAYLMPTLAERPEVLQVRVAARQQPVLAQFGPVTLDGLVVNVRKNRNGDLVQYWEASGVTDAGQGNRREHKQEQAA
jgi:hypothetical protein